MGRIEIFSMQVLVGGRGGRDRDPPYDLWNRIL